MDFKLDRIDLHIHTSFSDGVCSVKDVVKTAQTKRLNVFAITDHFNEFHELPKRMPKSQLKTYLNTLNDAGVIKGVEAEILSDGVSISKQTANLCALVLGGLHILHDRVFWYDNQPIWDPKSFVEDVRVTLIKALESDLIDVLVHPTWLPEDIRPQTEKLITKDWIESVVDAASDHEVAIEISGAWKVPDEFFIRECLGKGVKLSVGSDAHNASMIGDVRYAVNLLKRVNASSDSIFLPIRNSPR